DGTLLYTMDRGQRLQAIDIGGPRMVARGMLTVSKGGGARLFVANGIAYAPNFNSVLGGFATVDVTDPDHLRLMEGSDVVPPFSAPGTELVANGSGLGLLIGSNFANALDVMDISNPAKTNVFLTRINLPAAPSALALASGIAYVADGSAGLQVINY